MSIGGRSNSAIRHPPAHAIPGDLSMNRKSGVMLLLAILCGLGAMFGVRRLIGRDRGAGETQEILVAGRELRAEEVLKEEMVRVVAVPRANVPGGAFTSFKGLEERWVRIAMLPDEPIVEGKLAPK